MSYFPSCLKAKAPQLALILITLVWGGSFITVQYGLNFASPMFFVGCRFAAAMLFVSLFSWKDLTAIQLKEIAAGAVIGLVIALGYGTQTIGLQSISSSESAFLTALYVPLVPILLWLLFRKTPQFMTWCGTVLAFLGLVFLTGNGFLFQFNVILFDLDHRIHCVFVIQLLTKLYNLFFNFRVFNLSDHTVKAFSFSGRY